VSVQPVASRLGYTTSPAVYAPAASANGMTLSIGSGKASVYAGKLSAPSHRLLATVSVGQSYQVSGLAADEVLSVQSDAPFAYHLTLPARPAPSDPRSPPPAGPPSGASSDPATTSQLTLPARAPPTPAPPNGTVMHSTRAFWRCDHTPGCFSDAWTGAVIAWPAWAAHQSNGRTGNVLRSVFARNGAPLYPYMGAWAHGCQITAESGTAVVVEWQYGASTWRETTLQPRQSHVIQLVPPEDGALIESPEGAFEFSVSLTNCTPRRIEP
jgi:hypothetical protein